MLISTFKHEFRTRGGVLLNSSVILFRKPLELWNMVTGETLAEFKGNDVEVVLDYELDGKTIRSIIESWDHIPIISLHKRSGDSGFAYTHRGIPMNPGRGGKNNDTPDLPARFNGTFGAETSFDKALASFREKHGEDTYESGITVDISGFVTRYIHGDQGSVAISGGRNEMVIHNHPFDGWPTFSAEDLLATSMESSRGIVASSTKKGRTAETAKYAGDYIFVKGQHFNANAFIKGVKGAYLKGNDYNDAVHKWLTAHQKKYGYVYTYIPAK